MAGLSLAKAFFAEAAIYRQGWYYRYLEPESAAASVELPLYWLKRFRPRQTPEVLVIGDSRMAEGFSADQASLATGRRNELGAGTDDGGGVPQREADRTLQRLKEKAEGA